MNYLKLSKFDTANGSGIGTVIWLSGCSHHCPGCHNPQTWDDTCGKPFTQEVMQEVLNSISNPHVKRVTFSGGDPLYYKNRDSVYDIAVNIKHKYPDKKIWLYTGYLYEDVKNLPIMNYIDVLVDGKYEEDRRDISLPFCGSTNQRLIDIPQTNKLGKIVLWK